jgi:hypothetical protein
MPGTKRRDRIRRTVTGPLPDAAFERRRIVTRRPACKRNRSGPACGDDLSLARKDCPLPGHRYGVKAPGLPLPRHAPPSRKPFG